MDSRMIDKQRSYELIDNWFAIKKGAGLILPDGWFGRPHDNVHSLTYIEIRPHKLLLELDNQLLLIFTDVGSVYLEENELCFKDFSQLVFDWQEYGSMLSHATVYKNGIVKFICP